MKMSKSLGNVIDPRSVISGGKVRAGFDCFDCCQASQNKGQLLRLCLLGVCYACGPRPASCGGKVRVLKV